MDEVTGKPTGARVSVDGVGGYIAATVPLASVAKARTKFKVRGGGQMIALFAAQPSIWFRVGQVQASLRLQGVIVCRESVREGLDQLVEMGFLERSQKMIDCKKVSGAAHQYRRLLTEAQRDLLTQPVRVSAPLATAIRERRERRRARDAAARDHQRTQNAANKKSSSCDFL